MHALCLDDGLSKWFDFKVPKTTIPHNYIENALNDYEPVVVKPSSKVIWLGSSPVISTFIQSKKGNQREMMSLSFFTKKQNLQIQVPLKQGEWFVEILKKISIVNQESFSRSYVKESYEAAGLEDFELFWDNKPVNTLNKVGLLQL